MGFKRALIFLLFLLQYFVTGSFKPGILQQILNNFRSTTILTSNSPFHALSYLNKLDISKLFNQQRQQKLVKPYVDLTQTKFNAKHSSSFNFFTSSQSTTKQYLENLDFKLQNGEVFPGNFDKWLQKTYDGKKLLTTMDAIDLPKAKADIKLQVDMYKKKYGKSPDKNQIFTTADDYTVTQKRFDFKQDNHGEFMGVDINAQKISGKIQFGIDGNGELVHLEGISESNKKIRQEKIIASYTRTELYNHMKNKEKFYQDLGVAENKKPILLDVNNEKYKTLKQAVDELEQKFDKKSNKNKDNNPTGSCSKRSGGRRKRAADGGCACGFCRKPNGDVDSVHPKEVMDEYKKADPEGKTKIAEVAKDNIDKVQDGDGVNAEDKRKMKKLVQLEDVKKHVDMVNTVSEVESTKKGKSDRMSSMLDTITTKLDSAQTKLSNSKIALKLNSVAESKFGKDFGKGIGTVSSSLGAYFLAKTVVNGIIKGDTTSLVIVGARVGWEIGTGSAVWAGKKFFQATSKIGKAAKILGVLAGPIGAGADILLSIKSLTDSFERKKNSTNQYDKNGAIADIVSDSIDIGVTAMVTVLSIAFPPAAPIIIAVGAVIDLTNKFVTALYKGGNEVAKIHAEIPLLDFEKGQVFTSRFFDLFDNRKKDYIDHLLEEKAANDMAVKHNLQFLKENPAFLGIVFPSRTMTYDGGCSLTMQNCVFVVVVCVRYDEIYTLENDCDFDKVCSIQHGECRNYITKESWTLFGKYFTCVCDKQPKTSFGSPHQNSWVDYREKQWVHWERAVPKDVENAKFMCKPGSSTNQGFRISQKNPKWEYLCEHAIGLLQPSSNRKPGQVMLFDLEDGHDRVYLSEASSTPNLFKLGNEGVKEFVGGGGRNEFFLDGNCTQSLKGTLSGGRSDSDAITISGSCSKGEEIFVHFASGKLQSNGGNVDLSFSKIEEVNGRNGESERVVVNCATRKLVLGGGNSRNADYIDIPNQSCALNLTAVTSGYTKINSKASRGDISVLLESPWNLVEVKRDIYSRDVLNFNVIFMDTPSHQVLLEEFSVNGSQLQVTFRKSGKSERAKFDLKFVSLSTQDAFVYFTESPQGSPYSVLMLTLDNSPVFYHSLPKSQGHTRRGSISIRNVFEVIEQSWTAIGGDESDEFILHTPLATLDGGKGEDTIKLHKEYGTSAPLDLTGGRLQNIENVYGIAGIPIRIKTACDTIRVVPLGGSVNDPDVVNVPPGRCSKRELQIIAKGHTHVVVDGEVGSTNSDVVSIVAISEKEIPLQFELDTKSKTTSGLVNFIQVTHKNWTIAQVFRNNNSDSLHVHLIGNKNSGEFLKFNLHVSNKFEDNVYLNIPYIQFSQIDSNEPSGVLIIEAETDKPKVIYTLDKEASSGQAPAELVGFQGIQNIFRIEAPGPWKLTGGGENDVFSASYLDGVSINGGGGGENVLVLESHPSSAGKTFLVNLKKGDIGLLQSTEKGTVTNIHHVMGRQAQSDFLHASCSTKSMRGGGGLGEGAEDMVFISENMCKNNDIPQMTVEVGNYTIVKNSAKTGQFTYYVENLLTADIEVVATKNNMHFIKFASDPWTLIENTGFSQNDSTLGLKLKSGRIQEFPMFRKDNLDEYTNPVFEFHLPGSSVSSDIRIGANGAITSTFIIQRNGPSASEVVSGIPVDLNRFLINITEDNAPSSGGIIRGFGGSGGNQFWIFNLNSNLHTLDGGHCMESVGCTNYLQFGEGFHNGKPIEVDLDQEIGSVKVFEKVLVQNLKNMQEVQGRRNKNVYDKVYVACDTRSVSDFEEIRVRPAPENKECFYNLILGIGEHTRVLFEEPDSENYTSSFNDTFHYRFTTPRSFEVEGSDFMMLGGNHKYYLPFKLDDLEGMQFDEEKERLHYSISGREYELTMITSYMYQEQFYLQPVMITQDGFLLQVGFDGSILLSLGAFSSFSSLEEIQNHVIPALESTAQRLGATILLQTDKEFLFVGHGNITGDRNVVQNFGNLTSHLVGGGTEDTIYDISSLNKDVYIYSGFHELVNLEDFDHSNITKQTVDLTDVVVPIRFESGTKYLPKLTRSESHLVMSMEGYEGTYPGKVILYHGALERVASRLQFLLNSVIFDLVPAENAKNDKKWRFTRSVEEIEDVEETPLDWDLKPRPVQIPNGYVYSLSPEDLEDNQEIQIADDFNTTESPSKFKPVRKGADLYLTNVLDMSTVKEDHDPEEVTTVIISDFFKDSSESSSEPEENPHLPGTLSGISVSLPGLNVTLNDSDIITAQPSFGNNDENSTESSNPEMILIENLTEWGSVLIDVEERLLYDMPDIPKVFVCDGCVDSNLFLYSVITGLLSAVFLLSACFFICYKLDERKKGKYSVVNAKPAESFELLKKL